MVTPKKGTRGQSVVAGPETAKYIVYGEGKRRNDCYTDPKPLFRSRLLYNASYSCVVVGELRRSGHPR